MNTCLRCGKETNNAKYCSRSCSVTMTNIGVRRHGKSLEEKTKSCLNCGEDTLGVYCNNKCQQEYQYKKYVNEWLDGKEALSLSGHIRRYLAESKEGCWECGITQWNDKDIIIEVDHIDGNAANNNVDNLRCLCPNCHSQTDTFRNKGGRRSEARSYRKKYYKAPLLTSE